MSHRITTTLLHTTAVIAICLAASSCDGSRQAAVPAGEYEGTWGGECESIGLGLVFHLGDSTTFDSPDQSAFGIPAKLVRCSDGKVEVKVPSLKAGYKGKVQGDSIVGKFTQRGIPFPMNLHRGGLRRLRSQNPQPPFPYLTVETEFASGDASLSGTISGPGPESCTVAVLMVSGSGPQDRDENLMGHRPFAVLADTLAKAGITSLRYDDRGCFKSTGVFSSATTMDLAHDAAAGITHLRSLGYKKVGLLGHSEGGSIAFMLAGAPEGTFGDRPDFIISMAGMVDRGDSTLVRQSAAAMRAQGAPEFVAKLVSRTAVKQMAKSGQWWTYFKDLDPAPYVQQIHCPALFLNGDKDLQVIPKYNLEKIDRLLPGADTRLYPGLNHLFQHCDKGLATEYGKIEETIAPEVLSDIVSWTKSILEKEETTPGVQR